MVSLTLVTALVAAVTALTLVLLRL